ncbi:MAG: alpha-L-rhamnosidase N-terminal domain-containing protein [Bianqueaceae bacterium]
MDQNQTAAKWIWKDCLAGTNITCNFRRTFFLDQDVEEASLQISAHNHVKVYINGHRVSGICSPAASGFPNTKWYLTYDIAPYLVQGENVIAATVLFIGGDGQNHVTGCPALWFTRTAGCRTEQNGVSLPMSIAASRDTILAAICRPRAAPVNWVHAFDPAQEPRG